MCSHTPLHTHIHELVLTHSPSHTFTGLCSHTHLHTQGALLTVGLQWVCVCLLSLECVALSFYLFSYRHLYVAPELDAAAAAKDTPVTETDALLDVTANASSGSERDRSVQ